MLHGEAALAKLAGADGVHLPSGSDRRRRARLMGAGKLIGVSIHTVTEAEAIDPQTADYALAGPAFETPSKPGYGPEIGRKGLAEIARTARVPVLAIGGINAARVAEIIAAGCAGVAVMGGVMRAADPAQEVGALIATLQGLARYPRARIGADALIGRPDAGGKLSRLPEHVDRHAAARMEIAADAQPFRLAAARPVFCRSRPYIPRGTHRDCENCSDKASAISTPRASLRGT